MRQISYDFATFSRKNKQLKEVNKTKEGAIAELISLKDSWKLWNSQNGQANLESKEGSILGLDSALLELQKQSDIESGLNSKSFSAKTQTENF